MKRKFAPVLFSLVLFNTCLLKRASANGCPSGFQACVGNSELCCSVSGTIVNVAVKNQPKGCPPLNLYESNVGSVVCQTKCTDEGICDPESEKYAIKVENGAGTVMAPFDTGYSGERRCWIGVPTSCTMSDEFDPQSTTTCGTEYSYEIKQVGDSDTSNPVVDTLNKAVSSLLKIKLQKYCLTNANKICFLYWVIKIDVAAVYKIIKDNMNKLSVDNLKKMKQGKGLEIIWGWTLTSWTGVSVPASNMCTTAFPCTVKTREGEKCFELTVFPKIAKYQYNDRSVVFRDLIIGAGPRTPVLRKSWWLLPLILSAFSYNQGGIFFK